MSHPFRGVKDARAAARHLLKDFNSGESARVQSAIRRLQTHHSYYQDKTATEIVAASRRPSLTQAQHVIAREAGYDSWSDMVRDLPARTANPSATSATVSCARCGSPLSETRYCEDETCPFSDHLQACQAGWAGHPEHDHSGDAGTACTCAAISPPEALIIRRPDAKAGDLVYDSAGDPKATRRTVLASAAAALLDEARHFLSPIKPELEYLIENKSLPAAIAFFCLHSTEFAGEAMHPDLTQAEQQEAGRALRLMNIGDNRCDHVLYDCGICGSLHPWTWNGDCRDDRHRFADSMEYAERRGLADDSNVEVRSWSDREADDEVPDAEPANVDPDSKGGVVSVRGSVRVRGQIMVELEELGEGLSGDYNEEDPDDIEMLRFSVSFLPADEAERARLEDARIIDRGYTGWSPVEDASYCTQLPASLSIDEREATLDILMNEVYEPLMDGHDIDRLCQRLSWIDPETLKTRRIGPDGHGLPAF